MNTVISLSTFIEISIGQIYRLAPNHNPRNISEITNKVINIFKKDAQTVGGDFFYHLVDITCVYEFVENILMQIDEFKELNLSEEEYKNGVKVTDNRTGVYDDFVDLTACIRNISNILVTQHFHQYLVSEIPDLEMEHYLKRFYNGEERGEED